MLCLLIVISVSLLVYLFIQYERAFLYWKKRGVPILNPSVPFGDIGKIISSKLTIGDGLKEIYNQVQEKYVGLYCLKYPALFVKDLDLIQKILTKDFKYFTDHGFYLNEETEPTSGQLFRLKGEKWKMFRRAVNPAFSVRQMKIIFPEILDIGRSLNKYLHKVAKSGDDSVDSLDFCVRYSGDIIASTIFGIKIDSFVDKSNEYIQNTLELFEKFSRGRMIKFILVVLVPELVEILKPKTEPGKQEKFIHTMVKQIIRHREESQTSRFDIMQILINLKNKIHLTSSTFFNDLNLTDDDLAAQAYTYFYAGFETTSKTMNFLLYHCARDTNIQMTIQKEIDDLLIETNGNICYDTISKLKFLNQAILETLRLYPILPHLNRVSVEDYVLPESNSLIEKGTRILISISGIHHDKNYYDDPDKFDLNRFSRDNMDQRHPYSFLPFGEGPRSCIGKKMALTVLAVGIFMILKDFSVHPNAETPEVLNFTPYSYSYTTLKPIKLKLVKR